MLTNVKIPKHQISRYTFWCQSRYSHYKVFT